MTETQFYAGVIVFGLLLATGVIALHRLMKRKWPRLTRPDPLFGAAAGALFFWYTVGKVANIPKPVWLWIALFILGAIFSIPFLAAGRYRAISFMIFLLGYGATFLFWYQGLLSDEQAIGFGLTFLVLQAVSMEKVRRENGT